MPRRDPRERTIRDPFDGLVLVLMVLGAVVFVEPAPFDLLVVLIAPVALLLRRLAIPKASGFALICVGVYLFANIVSLIPSKDIGYALRFEAITIYLLIAWAFVLGLVGKYGERATRVIMLGWTIGAVVTTAIGVAGYFGVLPIRDLVTRSTRLSGFFKDANVLGAYLVTPAVWAASRLVSLERGRKLPWAVALVVCGVGVLLSYSRGAWIGLAIAMLMLFGLRLVGVGTTRARIMTLLAVPVAALLLGLALGRLTEIDVVQDTLALRLGMQDYDANRFATQREALEVAARSPFGIGPGQTELSFRHSTHNAYVRGFVEHGYLGGVSLILLLVGSQLRAIWWALELREPRQQIAMAVVAASLMAMCVESVVIDTIHWRHFWVLLALAWVPACTSAAASPPPRPDRR